MSPLVHQIPRYGMLIILPLLLHMNQGPLPSAKKEMLDPGNHKVIFFSHVHYIFSMNSTLSGIDASFLISIL